MPLKVVNVKTHTLASGPRNEDFVGISQLDTNKRAKVLLFELHPTENLVGKFHKLEQNLNAGFDLKPPPKTFTPF